MTQTATEIQWLRDRDHHGWEMPTAPWWKRIKFVRKIRAARLRKRARKESLTTADDLGLNRKRKEWLAYGVRHGYEQKP
jgi:hypothetical protein